MSTICLSAAFFSGLYRLRYWWLTIILTSFLFASCSRTTDDLDGQCTINGRLFFLDTLTLGSAPLPLSGRKIDIAIHPSDTLNYLYFVTTDSLGYFSFTGLQKKKSYDLFYRDSLDSMSILAFQSAVPSGDNTVLLQATPDFVNQSILHFIVTDNQNAPLANASICVFNSEIIFKSDSCDGSIYQIASDVNGRATIFNVAEGTYFIRGTAQYDSLFFTGAVTGTAITKPGTTTVPLPLTPQSLVGTLAFQLTDIYSQPVPEGTACVFDNQQIYTTAQGGCNGSIAKVSTDIYGTGSISGLHFGTYYVNAFAPLGTGNIIGSKPEITISQAGVVPVSITLQ